MKKISALAIASLFLFAACSSSPTDNDANLGPISVKSPQPNDVITSPLTVVGVARGTWYFEASFPITLLDGNGNELTTVPAQAQGEWMTEDFVPFNATLTFTVSTETGTLVLKKDNPSGLPENDQQMEIPVRFQ